MNTPKQIEVPVKREIIYICAKCGSENKFRIKEGNMSCPKCQNRVLYKKRTTEPVEFEAK
jgi:DNA-directed RNA polymerase subunit RPC12/RpoP